MKLITSVALLTGLVAGLPNRAVEIRSEIRSFDLFEDYSQAHALDTRASSNTRDELVKGGACPKVIFVFARGSTERGNLVCQLLLDQAPPH